ncbi:MAG TPA: glycoside hydrolase family 20 zincin-like fold domain-containing protein, partial [Flavisolibacter sp.]
MKNIFALLLAFTIGFSSRAQNIDSIAIIPEPVSMKTGKGSFILPKNIVIEAPSNEELQSTLAFLKERLSVPTGATVSVVSRS